MGIVDVFDALTTERSYKAALPFARAVEELQREAARGWRRADLVATFLNQVDQLDRRAERAAGLVDEAVSAGRRGPVDAGDY